MLTDAETPGSDDWWLVRLGVALGANFERLAMLDSYDQGTFVVNTEADPSVKEAYQRFANRARLTFGATIIDQAVGRMVLRSFRTATEDDVNGDKEANRLMRLNHFMRQFHELQRKKTLHGKAFFVVGHDDAGEPYLSAMDSWSVAVEMDSLRPWMVKAALVVSRDEVEGLDILTLLRVDDHGVPYGRVAVKEAKETTVPSDGTVWEPGTEWDWVASVDVAFDRIPIVPFTTPDGLGGFEKHIDSLDRITEDILERLTITAMQAFRQRAIETGDKGLPEYYPDDHPEFPGQRINYDEIYKGGPAALWLLPQGAKIWESAPVDPSTLTEPEKKDLEHLAGISATPLYAFNPDVNGSAEGAKLQRETIRTKISTYRKFDEESLAESMALLFQAYGDSVRADSSQISTIWGPIEYVSKADVAEAARAAQQAGKSQRFIDEHIFELTPEEMELEAQNLRDEQFQASLMGGSDGSVGGGSSASFGTQAQSGDQAVESATGAVG